MYDKSFDSRMRVLFYAIRVVIHFANSADLGVGSRDEDASARREFRDKMGRDA